MSQKRIAIHWTGGGPRADARSRRCYHYIVNQDGSITEGVYPPEANFKWLNNRDTYAAHLGGGNSFTIGVSLAGMAGRRKDGSWNNPLNRAQCEAAWKLVARLCGRYGIPVSAATVFTHYEFGLLNPGTDSRGKIDITALPFEPSLKPNAVGDYIRRKVAWYLAQEKKNGTP